MKAAVFNRRQGGDSTPMHWIRSLTFYFIVFLLSLLLAACTQGRVVAASLRSTGHFVPLVSDKRVLYEPGAEAYAKEIALLLPGALRKAEAVNPLPFKDAVEVYVCATRESCYRMTGHKAPAIVTTKLFISPALIHDTKPVDRYLAHELSHLQVLQRLGAVKSLKLPSWFKEGLAELASGGATGSSITDAEAEQAVIEGRSFTPDAGRNIFASFFSPRYGSYWSLTQPLFYHQSMLFVKYLQASNEAAFRELMISIQQGEGFGTAMTNKYGKDLSSIWEEYLRDLRQRSIPGTEEKQAG
jgi:hypothetical protein